LISPDNRSAGSDSLLTELFALARICLSAALVVMRTRSLPAARVRLNSRKLGTSGFFRFPFGRVHYAAASGLDTMFEELFLSQVYEVVKAAVSGTPGPAKFARHRLLTGHITSGEGLPIQCVRLSDRLEESVDLLRLILKVVNLAS
jgi:hypothetical protein